MAEWKSGICGCCNDIGACCVSYFLPCYAVGKSAEAVGDSCLVCGLGYMFLEPVVAALVRSKVRERRNIPGNFISDLACACCCHCCTIAQMYQEIQQMQSGAQAVERE